MQNVRDFGAKGDGVSKDTMAIQKAIDAGGMVHFPPGIYLSGTLYLKSGGGLHLEAGAVLLASPDPEDYNAADFCPQNRDSKLEIMSGAHLITAVEQSDICITGGGRIDGNRKVFYGTDEEPGCVRLEEKFDLPQDTWRPGQMLFLCECTRVQIQNVQLFNAPYWTCFLHGCEDVMVSGIRILNDQRTKNGDGIDIDCCRRVTVSDCIIDSGDDCITLRANWTRLKQPKPCEYITITNCVLHTNCNAFRIGVGNGLIRRCTISNIVFHDTRTAVCLVSNYSCQEKEVQIEDISFSNLQMECVRPFFFGSTPSGSLRGLGKVTRNISVNQIRGTAALPSIIQGSSQDKMENISFSDVELSMNDFKTTRVHDFDPQEPYGEFCKNNPNTAFLVQRTKNISFRNVNIFWDEVRDPVWKFGLISDDSENIACTDCDFGKENQFSSR
ncbi:MAG: glycosyl hydrolase family 28 protein [Lentisphaeria bacterium]